MVQASQSSSLVTTFKVAGAFSAFLIGPGFSTGQEIMQFFASEGLRGVGGALLFLAICAYVSVSLLLAGREHGFRNLEEVFKYYTGPLVGTLYTWYTTVLVYSVYALMLAGAAAILHEYYELPIFIGSGLMALAVLATLFFGLRELVNVVASIGPVLIVLLAYTAITAILGNVSGIETGHAAAESLDTLRASGSWWMSGLLYSALQVTGLFSFLPSLGATIERRNEAIIAGIVGTALIFLALLLVMLALLGNLSDVAGKMIPMLYLAESTHMLITPIFALVLLAGIFTTCAPLLWVVLVKFRPDASRGYRKLAVVLTAIGYAGSLTLPFDQFVNLIYPTIGYSGMILIGFMLVKQIRNRSLV